MPALASRRSRWSRNNIYRLRLSHQELVAQPDQIGGSDIIHELCTLALSPIRDTHPEGFSYFVTSIAAPVASGWSVRPGGTFTHWKAPPF